jgi:hypothetical protein
MLNCCWCLEWITVWEFSSAHWCWLWILMMPSITECAWSLKSTNEAKKCSSLRWTKYRRKFFRAGKSSLTHKLNFFGSMLISIFFFVLVCGNRVQSFFFCVFCRKYINWTHADNTVCLSVYCAQNSSTPFSYILYTLLLEKFETSTIPALHKIKFICSQDKRYGLTSLTREVYVVLIINKLS